MQLVSNGFFRQCLKFFILLNVGWVISACQTLDQALYQPRFIENPTAKGSQYPYFSSLPDGSTLMSWVEGTSDHQILKFAIYQQERWVHQGKAAEGPGWYVNWADYPAIVAIDDSFWVAHWRVKSRNGQVYDYDVFFSVSVDAGASWSQPQKPYQDATPAGHGFVSVFPALGGAGLVWLDGREVAKKISDRFSLRYALIHRDGHVDSDRVIDDNTCTCCWTTSAVSTKGPVVMWRSRRGDEIRDHHLAQFVEGVWSEPLPVSQEGWSIAGCPVNGPSIAANGTFLVASWFTAEGNRPRVRSAFADDSSLQFDRVLDIDELKPIGRTSVRWLTDKTAVVIWLTAMDKVTRKANIAARTMNLDGSLGKIKLLSEISPGRDSGVPQIAKTQTSALLAWTQTDFPSGVKVLLIPLKFFD